MSHFHRLNFLPIICFLAIVIWIAPANALFDSNVKKAKEFMQAGMYPQAIALLEKEINDNPTNAEAHFQLGVCYVNQSNYSRAEERFASTVRLKPDYGYKIGKEYKKVANYNLTKGRLSSLRSLYDKATGYDPSLTKGIAQELFDKGKNTGNDNFFAIAVSYNANLKDNVANYYYSQSHNSQGEATLSLLAKASQYSIKYTNDFAEKKLKVGNSFLTKAKESAKIPGKEKETEESKKKAIKYLGKNAVSEALPEYRIYEPGEYAFKLKAGEQTDHWVMFPFGRNNTYNLHSKDYKFKLIFDDGDLVPAWTPGKWPHKTRVKFKIIAVTDQSEIKLTVK